MWHALLGIENASDVIHLDSVDDDVMEGWKKKRPGYPGPTIEEGKLQMDWWGGKKSQWNIKAFELLATKLKNAAAQKWSYLPRYNNYYYEFTVIRKYNDFHTKWRAARPKLIGPGITDFETEEQINDRLAELSERDRRWSRQNKRRHTVCRTGISIHLCADTSLEV